MCIYIYIYIYTHTHTYTYAHTYTHTFTYTYYSWVKFDFESERRSQLNETSLVPSLIARVLNESSKHNSASWEVSRDEAEAGASESLLRVCSMDQFSAFIV